MEWQAATFFESPVFKFQFANTQDAKDFFFEKIRHEVNDTERYEQGELSHYHSRSNVFNTYPELKALGDQLERAGTFVYQQLLNYQDSGPLKMTNAWYNLCEVGGTQPMHNHVNCLLCGTIYLHADPNTKIQFEHPQANPASHAELYDRPSDQPNQFGLKFHQRIAQIGLKTGDCLFWPAHLKHGYSKNQTPGRLTLSFNLMPETLNVDYQVRANH